MSGKSRLNKVCRLGWQDHSTPVWLFPRYSLKISTLTVTLTMRTAIKPAAKHSRQMMIHHYTITRFGCKRFKSAGTHGSNTMKQLCFEDFFSLYCDLDLEGRIRNPNFLHDTSGLDDTPTYHVSCKKERF